MKFLKLLELEKQEVMRYFFVGGRFDVYLYHLGKAWKRMVTKVTYVGEGFTRKPPKYERFIRPMVCMSALDCYTSFFCRDLDLRRPM